MMNESDVRSKLNQLIESDLIFTQGKDKKTSIEIDKFTYLFSESTLDFESLYSNSNATNAWKDRFQLWKEWGLIE